jgi:hypothetical protein
MKPKFFIRAAILAPIGLSIFITAASANVTLPSRKPGLWETTMTMTMTMNGQTMGGNMPPVVRASCSSAATDAEGMKRMASGNGKCGNFDIEGSGDVYTLTGTCTSPMGGTMSTHATITRISDDEFTMQSQTTSPNMSGSMTGDSKWMGACPDGTVPGDYGVMQNGQFVKQGNFLTNMQPPAPQ